MTTGPRKQHSEIIREISNSGPRRCRSHFGVLDPRVRCDRTEGHDHEHSAAVGLYWHSGDPKEILPAPDLSLAAEQAEDEHVRKLEAEEARV